MNWELLFGKIVLGMFTGMICGFCFQRWKRATVYTFLVMSVGIVLATIWLPGGVEELGSGFTWYWIAQLISFMIFADIGRLMALEVSK